MATPLATRPFGRHVHFKSKAGERLVPVQTSATSGKGARKARVLIEPFDERSLLRRHGFAFAGASRFSSSNQLSTTAICVLTGSSVPGGGPLTITKCCPSGDGS